jgi:hypothetical protein
MIKFVRVNHPLGATTVHDAVRKAESDEYQWQQGSILPQIDSVNRNISVNGMRNQ